MTRRHVGDRGDALEPEMLGAGFGRAQSADTAGACACSCQPSSSHAAHGEDDPQQHGQRDRADQLARTSHSRSSGRSRSRGPDEVGGCRRAVVDQRPGIAEQDQPADPAGSRRPGTRHRHSGRSPPRAATRPAGAFRNRAPRRVMRCAIDIIIDSIGRRLECGDSVAGGACHRHSPTGRTGRLEPSLDRRERSPRTRKRPNECPDEPQCGAGGGPMRAWAPPEAGHDS